MVGYNDAYVVTSPGTYTAPPGDKSTANAPTVVSVAGGLINTRTTPTKGWASANGVILSISGYDLKRSMNGGETW